MPTTIPFVKGYPVDKTWNLDDAGDLTKLGFPGRINSKKVDRYCHFQNCPHALVEFTRSKISDGVEQLEECANIFKEKGKPVDYLILVIGRFSKRERNIFGSNKERKLVRAGTNKPITVKVNGADMEILLYTDEQARITRRLMGQ